MIANKKRGHNMKSLKKIFALLIAMVMVLGMSTSVFAAQTEGTTASITITTDATYEGSTQANVYKAYKIFDASYTSLTGTGTQDAKDPTYNPTDAAVSYFMKTGNPWISTVQGMTDYFTVSAAADGSGYNVTLKSGVDNSASTASAIATALKNALPASLAGDYAAIEVTAGGSAVSVQPGYYLIASDTATNLALVTTDVTIVEKNTYLTDNKTVSTTNLNVGDNATYYIVVIVPSNVTDDDITVHDELASALKFNNDVQVYSVTTGTNTPTTSWTAAQFAELTYSSLGAGMSVVKEGTALTHGEGADAKTCTFHIVLDPDADGAAIKGKTFVFKYTAELTSEADPDGDGYVNKEYTSNPNYKTNENDVTVKTYDFTFTKTFVNGAATNAATFELRTTANDASTAIAFITDTDLVSGADVGYVKADSDDSGTTTITGTQNKKTNVNGLAAGTYYLVETGYASGTTGYNMMTAPVVITIAEDGTATYTCADTSNSSNTQETAASADNIQIVNQSGSVLPSTGGIGTTIFYVIGAILVLGAGILLVTRRRMNAN